MYFRNIGSFTHCYACILETNKSVSVSPYLCICNILNIEICITQEITGQWLSCNALSNFSKVVSANSSMFCSDWCGRSCGWCWSRNHWIPSRRSSCCYAELICKHMFLTFFFVNNLTMLFWVWRHQLCDMRSLGDLFVVQSCMLDC